MYPPARYPMMMPAMVRMEEALSCQPSGKLKADS